MTDVCFINLDVMSCDLHAATRQLQFEAVLSARLLGRAGQARGGAKASPKGSFQEQCQHKPLGQQQNSFSKGSSRYIKLGPTDALNPGDEENDSNWEVVDNVQEQVNDLKDEIKDTCLETMSGRIQSCQTDVPNSHSTTIAFFLQCVPSGD